MILVDTSAWIEFTRATGSAADRRLDQLIGSGADLAIAGPVAIELLAGALDPESVPIRRALLAFELLALEDPNDWSLGATIYRTCLVAGETIRSLIDCLLAAVAIRTRSQILHHNRDFDAIARHTPLELA